MSSNLNKVLLLGRCTAILGAPDRLDEQAGNTVIRVDAETPKFKCQAEVWVPYRMARRFDSEPPVGRLVYVEGLLETFSDWDVVCTHLSFRDKEGEGLVSLQ